MSAAYNGEAETTTGLLDSSASLKPFLDILGSSNSAKVNFSTVRSMALKIFAHPQIFTGFDEFKSRCASLLTEDSASASLFRTLDLFSFGTLKDYNDQAGKDYYLPLNEPALAKLGQLTVLTCIQEACFRGETSVSYDVLAEALGSASAVAMQEDGAASASVRETEAVLIRCVYSNVLRGKLCQKTKSFGWKGEQLPIVLSRDVASESVAGLLSALQGLGQRLEQSQQDVGNAQGEVTNSLQSTADHWNALEAQKKIPMDDGKVSASSLLGRGSVGNTLGGSLNPRRSSKRSRALGPANFVPMHRGSDF